MAQTSIPMDAASTPRRTPGHLAPGADWADLPVAVVDVSGQIVETNAAWALLDQLHRGHRARDDAVGAGGVAQLVPRCAASAEGDLTELAVRSVRHVLTGEVDRVELEFRCDSSMDEHRYRFVITAHPDRSPGLALVRQTDVTAAGVRDDNLADLPTLHARTGLPGRVAILNQLETAAALAPPEARPVLVRAHLDGLRGIADQHGRPTADDVVVLLAARLRRVVRVDDVVGADDDGTLVVLCPSADDARMEALATRIQRVLSAPVQVGVVSVDARPRVQVERSTEEDTPVAAVDERPRSGDVTSIAVSSTLSQLIDASNDVTMLFDEAGIITWVSDAAREVFKVDPDRLLGHHRVDFIHPDDHDRAVSAFMSIPRLGQQSRVEFRVLAADGSIVWVEEQATNLLDEPLVGAVHASLRDITERKRAEDQIEFQARLLDAVGQALVAIDDDRRICYWNVAAEHLYGWPRTDAMGTLVDEVVQCATGWTDRYADLVAHVDRGSPWTGELRILHRDGHVVPAMVTMTPVFDERRRQIASIAVASDLSDHLRSVELAARWSAVVESSHDAILSTTLDGTITTWNPAATVVFGRPAQEMLGRTSLELAPTELRPEMERLRTEIAAGEALNDVEMLLERDDGSAVALSLSLSPIRDDQGRPIGASVVARDLTERRELEARLREDHARLVEAQEIAHLGSYEYDLETGVMTRSDEFDRIFDLAPDADSAALEASIHPDDAEEAQRDTQRVLAGHGPIERTLRLVRRDGSERWVRCRSTLTQRGGHSILTGTALDVTDQHLAELALTRQTRHDSLTGLLNRTGLHAHLSRLLATDDSGRLAVAIVDLDRFKVINDTLGHRVGDETLTAVADRLRTQLAPDDVIARLGGDEFVLVRSDVADLDHARMLATDALEALEAPIVVGHRRFDISASIGVTLSASVDSAESLLSDADAAMYLAKADGGTAVSVFDQGARERANRHLVVSAALRDAVARGELSVRYQPIVSIAHGTVHGFEALSRWQHPRLGAISPEEFIPIAEASGAIVPLGRWTIGAVLDQLAQWRSRPDWPDDLWIAINLCAAQLGEPGFLEWFADALERRDVPARCVHLEITEGVLISHIERAVDTVAALRSLGTSISIDDFGTGYSSLSYLDQLPVDVLKVDRSFVERLGPAARDGAVVRSVVALAGALELEVVVEGVEREAQRALVAELGCELGQGYLWSRPLSADDATRYVAAHR